MKGNLSKYFSANRFSRWPIWKMAVSGVVALVVAGSGLGLAAGAAVQALAPAATPVPTPEPTATPVPYVQQLDTGWLKLNWNVCGIQPAQTAASYKAALDLSSRQQTLYIEVYATNTVTGKTTFLKDVPVQVYLTCAELSEVEDEDNKHGSKASVKGATTQYDLNTKTGKLEIPKLDPGKYAVSLKCADGRYSMPKIQYVTVKEKVDYKKNETTAKDETAADAKEDKKPQQNTGEQVEISVTKTGFAYLLSETKTWSMEGGDAKYLYAADGTTQMPFRIETKDVTGADAKADGVKVAVLYKAVYDANAQKYLHELKFATPTPSAVAQETSSARRSGLSLTFLSAHSSSAATLTEGSSSVPAQSAGPEVTPEPTPEPTPVPTPTPTPTPDPTATPTAEPTPTPETATPTPSGGESTPTPTPAEGTPTPTPTVTPEGSASPSPTPSGSPTATPTATPTETPEPTATATPTATPPMPTAPAVTEYALYKATGEQVTGTPFLLPGAVKVVIGDSSNTAGKVVGIDVSKYQPNINWKEVKAAGVEFVIIRVGFRGYGSGAIVKDPYFEQHLKGAKAAGLKVGLYFFSQAIDEQEAVDEASACLNAIAGQKLDYPIFFDSEYSTSAKTGRADKLTKGERTACAVAFCETIRKGGYQAGVYASTSWFNYQLSYSTVSKYTIWNAHYGVSASPLSCQIWQYTGNGRVQGVYDGYGNLTACDINYSYMG